MGRIARFLRFVDRRFQSAADRFMRKRLQAGGAKHVVATIPYLAAAVLSATYFSWLVAIGYSPLLYIAAVGVAFGAAMNGWSAWMMAKRELATGHQPVDFGPWRLCLLIGFAQVACFFWLPPYPDELGITLDQLFWPNLIGIAISLSWLAGLYLSQSPPTVEAGAASS